MEELTNYAPKDVSVILLGNKSDLMNERTTSHNEASNLAFKYGVKYIEVSAKTGNNVVSVFESLTNTMISKEEENEARKLNKKDKKRKIENSNVSVSGRITLTKAVNDDKQTKCCK